ncbi:MAG: SpoIIE family protein phosphatase [Bacteroidota bacterium]|nr:SpoIIE family protein phosphatase [Bacteroidota bacterium]
MRIIVIYIVVFLFGSIDTVAQKQALARQDSVRIHVYEQEMQAFLDSDKKMLATRAMNHIAKIYWDHSHNREAIDYFERSMKINEQIGNEHGISELNINLAMLYTDLGDNNKSLSHFQKGLVYIKSRNNPAKTVEAYLNVATAQKRLKKYKEAQLSIESGLTLAKKNNLQAKLGICYGELSDLFIKTGEKDKAEHYYQLYYAFLNQSYKDSKEQAEIEKLRRENTEKAKKIQELELIETTEELSETKEKIEYINARHKQLADSLSKKEALIALVKEEARSEKLENEKLTREKEIQKSYTKIAIFIIAIVIGFLVYMIFTYRKIKRINNKLTFKNSEINQKNEEINTQAESIKTAKEEIEKKHRLITSSIDYAQLIQKAMMNPKEKLNNLWPNSFIWYAPRDVVSGDFFWYIQVKNKLIIAAGDCTGHGVPGGFLSMTGHNLLSQIIHHRGIVDPAGILNELESEFSLALHQEFSDNMDGIDISICVIDTETKKLHFSGAKSPLLIIENKEIKVLEPDNYSIGGISFMRFAKQTKKSFTTQTIKMPADFSFYMHSDGPVDQFNKIDKERLMKKRLYEMILATDHLPAEKQKQQIIENFNDWKGPTKQTDDILLIGGRIKNFKFQ